MEYMRGSRPIVRIQFKLLFDWLEEEEEEEVDDDEEEDI